MSERDRLQRLGGLAGLIFDLQLSRLEAAARAKAESEALLEGLARPATEEAGLIGAAGAVAALTYQRWADLRRAEINQQLARQTAEWLEAQDAARSAFGRKEALRRLTGKRR